MHIALTALTFLFGIVAHAAHLAPWNPYGGDAIVGTAADGHNVLLRVSSSDVDTLSYDLVGNLLSASNPVACEAFAYDLRDRLTNPVTRIGVNSWTFSWARDAGGLVTNVTYGAGKVVSCTYRLTIFKCGSFVEGGLNE